jgi:hypothetical protein
LSRAARRHAEREAEDGRAAVKGRIELRVEMRVGTGPVRVGKRFLENGATRATPATKVDRSRQWRVRHEQVDTEWTRRFDCTAEQVVSLWRRYVAPIIECAASHTAGQRRRTPPRHRRLNDRMRQPSASQPGCEACRRRVVHARFQRDEENAIGMVSGAVSRTAIAAASSSGYPYATDGAIDRAWCWRASARPSDSTTRATRLLDVPPRQTGPTV